MRLFDTHAHITDTRYENDQAEMLNLCTETGVELILCPGVDMETSRLGVELANQYTQVYASVGIHPEDATDVTEEDYEKLYRYGKEEEKVVAIGEIGLDYYWKTVSPEEQAKVFVRQMDIARELNLPIIVHDREAHDDLLRLLQTEGKGVRGILHCFSGDMELAKAAMKLDYFISFAGNVVFPKAVELKEIASQIPMSHLLIETDSPYLTPPPFRGRRNSPANVQYVAMEIAKLRHMDPDEVAYETLLNGKRCFGI